MIIAIHLRRSSAHRRARGVHPGADCPGLHCARNPSSSPCRLSTDVYQRGFLSLRGHPVFHAGRKPDGRRRPGPAHHRHGARAGGPPAGRARQRHRRLQHDHGRHLRLVGRGLLRPGFHPDPGHAEAGVQTPICRRRQCHRLHDGHHHPPEHPDDPDGGGHEPLHPRPLFRGAGAGHPDRPGDAGDHDVHFQAEGLPEISPRHRAASC